jgi:ABC-type transport system involved in multi-copper enzyme maturation permease subunit
MLSGPVLQFDLLAIARRRRYYAVRLAYGLFLLWIVWMCYPNEPAGSPFGSGRLLAINEARDIAQAVFLSVAAAQIFSVLAITPALVAGVVADEKQRKTLHYLLASPMSSAEIVLGKLGSRMITASVFLALALPILSLLGLLGGVDPNDVLLLYAGCGSIMFAVAAFAAAVSVHARRPREAVSAVYLAVLAWLLGPVFLKHMIPLARSNLWPAFEPFLNLIAAADEWVGASSPLFVLVDSPGMAFWNPARRAEVVLWMIGLQLLAGLALTVWAVFRLRPVQKAEGARNGLARVLRPRRFLPRPACGDDPLIWKELYVSRTTPAAKLVATLCGLGVVALLAYWAWDFIRPVLGEIRGGGYWATVGGTAHRDFTMFVRFVATALLVCGQLGAAALAAGALSSEREEDTWVSLIATPLSPFQIVRAKLLGALWSVRLVAALWLLLVGAGVALGCVHPVGMFVGGLAAAADVWFFAVLGMFYSLRARSSARALTATIATWAVCNGLYTLLFVRSEVGTSMVTAGVTAFVEWISLVSYADVAQFPNLPIIRKWDVLDYGLTVVVSVLGYAAVAGLLTFSLVTDFDDVIDRPRTLGGRPRRRRRPGHPVGVGKEAALVALEDEGVA